MQYKQQINIYSLTAAFHKQLINPTQVDSSFRAPQNLLEDTTANTK